MREQKSNFMREKLRVINLIIQYENFYIKKRPDWKTNKTHLFLIPNTQWIIFKII